MYQSYPSGGQEPEPAQQSPTPPSVVNAVRLMYVGAAISAIAFVVSLFVGRSSKSALHKSHPSLTAQQINTAVTIEFVFVVIVGLVSVGLWLWLARACGKGRNWARVTGTVLFGIDTLLILLSLLGRNISASFIVTVLIWLVGLGAIVLLWRKESSAFFTAKPAA